MVWNVPGWRSARSDLGIDVVRSIAFSRPRAPMIWDGSSADARCDRFPHLRDQAYG